MPTRTTIFIPTKMFNFISQISNYNHFRHTVKEVVNISVKTRRELIPVTVVSDTFLTLMEFFFFSSFFLNFWRTHVLFVGPLIPLFWTSGDICPGFQSQGGLACMLSCLRAIPLIHLWCDTCWPLDGLHGSLPTLTHVLAAFRRIHKHWWHWGQSQGSNLWPGLGLKPTTYRATAQRTLMEFTATVCHSY